MKRKQYTEEQVGLVLRQALHLEMGSGRKKPVGSI